MELRLQPKPEVKITPADRGIVSWSHFFVKKEFEEIKPYFFSALFVRDWKPKAELIYPPVSNETTIQYECDFNRNVQNCFVEDYAEEVFLRTPPPCFVVIGKSGKSVKKLSQELAEEYGSVLIQVDDIVSQVLKRNTETSKILDRLLRFGVGLSLNFILALLSYVAHTAEARHRGYVLCGLPCPPLSQDLLVDDQFNYLFTWENKPTVFIHVLFDDEDLIKERTNLYCELKGTESEKSLLFHSKEVNEEDDIENEDDELLVVKEDTLPIEKDINISPSRPWIQLPKDEESQVWSELELFDNIITPAIKLVKSRIDPQYFLTVDSRVQNELELVLARLSLLQIWKVPQAVPFISPKEKKITTNDDEESKEEEVEEEKSKTESEYSFDVERVIEEPPEVAFLTLFSQKTISPKFRWELSHYNYICPVSLRDGEFLKGKSEFAVIFLKYIYFLHDKESMLKFIQNPRAYVLPVRPKPSCRFIILGYPFSGKTSLAKALANEFSLPLVDLNTVLKEDYNKKKNTYQEFCRQKAECRENIRLTSQAWQDWRMEEEQRLYLIEEWILYIEILLSRRIEQFYSTGEPENLALDKDPSVEEIRIPFPLSKSADDVQRSSGMNVGENVENLNTTLEVRGTALDVRASEPRVGQPPVVESETSPSARLIQAMKHEDFDFNNKKLEVQANLFFSSLWKSFSNENEKFDSKDFLKKEDDGEGKGEQSEAGEGDLETEEKAESVGWVHLLPPQSLSSFLMGKKPTTTREKRESFKTFLDAASKVYWAPCKLKAEFAKWRLPCYMDIPLCEKFLDNPLLLLIYVPEWLKERPLIPDPVDPNHPSILEAGRKAYERAGVVTVKQNQEEVGILLRDALEKAEREGMRVTGEVITPGGWVVDNMTLDLSVWEKLACDQVFADHIYILVDTDPEYRRIINHWWDTVGRFLLPNESFIKSKESSTEEEEEDVQDLTEVTRVSDSSGNKETNNCSEELSQSLLNSAKAVAEGDEELDEIYNILMDDTPTKCYVPPFLVDSFSHNMLENTIETWEHLKEEFGNEEALVTLQTLNNSPMYNMSSTSLFYQQQLSPFTLNFPLGAQLEIFSSKLFDYFKKKSKDPNDDRKKSTYKESLAQALEFFILLLTLPKKLEELKEWLITLGAEGVINEIVMTGKTREEIFSEIKKHLSAPFIKKPRELESFEVEEIKAWTERENPSGEINNEGSINEPENEDEGEKEDVRVFGESGQLCIVNLERDICLLGKPEFALRYYGKLYYFWNQNAKDTFMNNPEKYAPYYSAIRCYPPLRVFVLGPIGSGKTTLTKAIANQCSVNAIHYTLFITRVLAPHTQARCRKYLALSDQKLLIAENHNPAAKLAKENFLKAPKNKRQFWLENPFYLDFFDNEKFIDNLINITEPATEASEEFPELIYINMESVLDGKLHDEESSVVSGKTDVGVPENFYLSMKEIEIMINNYLENNNDLEDYCIEKSYKTLWTKEPYISQGFVLEGFPLRANDVQFMTEDNFLPDIVIEIVLPEDDVIERNITRLMELWDIRLKHETIEEKSIEDTLKTIQKVCMHYRRHELLKDKKPDRTSHSRLSVKTRISEGNIPHEDSESHEMKTKFENLSERSFESQEDRGRRSKQTGSSYTLHEEVETQAEEKVENILAEEFPTMIFSPVFETYDAGKERVSSNLVHYYKKDGVEIEKIKSSLTALEVPWLEVDGLKNLDEIFSEIYIKLDKIKKRVDHKGEFAFPMKMETAEKLLQQGYYFLSKFGRWCPVQVYRMKNPIHMFRPLKAKNKITPIAYRNYIYFVGGENEKEKFIEDPIKYTFNQPHHPNIPLRIAVIGPPKSGKSTLSQRLGTMFDLKVVTMGSALRFALEKTPESTLAKTIQTYLRRGCFLPLSLKVEAILLSLNDPSCVTQGFVFDGIPFDAALTQSLAEKGKLPFVIISLVADSFFGLVNRQNLNLNSFRLPYKNRTNMETRYNDWNNTYKRFAQWNQDTYNNLYEVNAKLSVVDVFYQSYDIIRKSFFAILYYVENCVSDRALPLHYLCVSQHEYELRKSSFHNNCPVCWVELNKLSNSFDPPPRSGLVQYLNHFYWICPDHMEKFIKNPKMYISPAINWPELLPKRLNKTGYEKAILTMKVHGFGRCPVTRIDFPSSLDWEGSYEFVASYGGEIYFCKSEEMLDRFLARPWRYYNADTRFEVNRPNKSNAVEQLGPPKIMSLPPIGFLEQTVADLIHECLQILGIVRPVYPNMSPTVTGCIFVALYLKVYNKKTKASYLERRCLDFMLQCCRASNYHLPPAKLAHERLELGQGDFEPAAESPSDSSSEGSFDVDRYQQTTSDDKSLRSDPHLLEFQFQGDKIIWSAKNLSDKYFPMRMTESDELIEIPHIPKVPVVLKYQTYSLRPTPIPPIPNCLNFVYSCKPNLKIPEKFNYNTLYQPPPLFSSPFTPAMVFNPEKQFAQTLYTETQSGFPSKTNLHKHKRCISNSTIESNEKPNVDPVIELVMERFVPRFQLFDKLVPGDVPSIPKVLEKDPIVFNPHRDYAYTVLFSEFFRTTQVLKCYEWNESQQLQDYMNRMDKNLGLTNVQVDYFFKPHTRVSEKSVTSLNSYQKIFDAASTFYCRSEIENSESSHKNINEKPPQSSSLVNFFHGIILQSLDQMLNRLSESSLSYDNFEMYAVSTESKDSTKFEILIKEVLPYPPLPWDIITRPYYAYSSISSIFQTPPLDDIAHERHVSLLDGITEPDSQLRFVPFPSLIKKKPKPCHHKKPAADVKTTAVSKPKDFYFYYDFFNLPWASFLTYPHSWAYNIDITDGFSDVKPILDSPCPQDQLGSNCNMEGQ